MQMVKTRNSANRMVGDITDVEKEAVWNAYRDRRPTRVPLRWNTNPRVILLNPELNPEGYTFEQYFKDPRVTLMVLPLHEQFYGAISNTTPSSANRFIHLCGDVMRHLPIVHKKLGVTSFDTGFPVDHGLLRRQLGPDVEIAGGPHVGLLRYGTPEQCAARAKEILQSGIMEGGRFILQEANNLPPGCPMANLEAVYETCLEYGVYR